ncbi:MAG: NusG domain II-containing protein [Butyrivibrio sp.]
MQKNALKKLFKSHKFDFLLGAVVLLAALCLFLVFRNTQKPGGVVRIKQDNKIVGEYSLAEDGEYPITSFYGSNLLVIKDGECYMAQSSCNDHLCEKMGHISKVGETIICLPNEVFITVISGESSDYDAVLK